MSIIGGLQGGFVWEWVDHGMRRTHADGRVDWLYGGDLRFEGERGYFTDVRDARFIERTAKEGRSYDRLWLREADYQPETVQFYRRVDIPFVRALRQVGVDQPADELLTRRQEAKASVMRATSRR